MADTLTYLGELTVTTCWCGTRHAVPQELYNYQRRQFDNGREVTSIFCPLGHQHQPAGKGKAQLERERREAVERELANARDDARVASIRADRAEAETKRLKKRATAGVCPCCNRSFVQLSRHMKSKHPDVAT